MRDKPFIFIGSSAEGLEAAKGIQANLEYSCECQIWSQGLFGLSGGTLEKLVKSLSDFDFAILVLTEDDITISRDNEQKSPRDNVIFELGLFIGGLGLDRTFIVIDRKAKLKLPSDLGGITPATFEPPVKGTIQSALGTACLAIEQAIKKLGARNEIGVTAHWYTKCIEDGVTEHPDFFMTVFNRTNQDLPWLNVHIFPSNTFSLIPVTDKKDRLMAGQYAMYQFKMYDETDTHQLTKWAERFSNEKAEELSVRIFKEHTADEPVLISYELGEALHKRILKYK
jgi:hypothetical protein